MSFLNPVSLPVKRFKSTDAGAPQINYAARTAGDVKAVLKACLVTGYGTTASAGWSIVNEVDHVCEFVSPSFAMSDYRLGIDDSNATSTTWYYQYQDARKNPTRNAINRSVAYRASNAKEGWQLLTTQRGLVFVEIIFSNIVNEIVSRVTYFGALKSSQVANMGENMGFWCAGFGAPSVIHEVLRSYSTEQRYFILDSMGGLYTASAVLDMFATANNALHANSVIDLHDSLYLTKGGKLVGQHPALLLKTTNSIDNLFGVYDSAINDRPVLHASPTLSHGSYDVVRDYTRNISIYLDYWEY